MAAKIFPFVLIVGLSSCDSSDSHTPAELRFSLEQGAQKIWVDGSRVSCEGLIEQQCYRVQATDVVDPGKWEYLYEGIEGFDETYEEGFIYQLEIDVIDVVNPPADASSLRYVFIKVVSKTPQ